MDTKAWAEIIKSAAQSNLGILALMVLVVCLLALVFFRNASERIRLCIFLLLFAGVVMFTASVIIKSPRDGQTVSSETVQSQSEETVNTHAIEGIWYAEVPYSWGVTAMEQFDFTVDGNHLAGTASFNRLPRQIVAGALSGNRLHFTTEPGDTSFQYRAEIGESQLQFTLDNQSELPTRFVAARTVEAARKLLPRLPTGGTEPILSSIVAGAYELEYIKLKVRELHTDIRKCFVATEFDPVDHVYVNYFLKIAQDGTVMETGAPGTDQRSSELDRCMDRAFRNTNWGSPPGNGDTEIKLAFEALPAWRSQ